MTKSAKITTTKTEGWQQICWGWAQSRELFEIKGIGARHLAFCKELCAAYKFECQYESLDEKATAIFTPLPR
jgi:hypothetical protein